MGISKGAAFDKFLYFSLDLKAAYEYFTLELKLNRWRDGGEATQRIANPCTPVQIRFAPPKINKINFLFDFWYFCDYVTFHS